MKEDIVELLEDGLSIKERTTFSCRVLIFILSWTVY